VNKLNDLEPILIIMLNTHLITDSQYNQLSKLISQQVEEVDNRWLCQSVDSITKEVN